MNITEKGKGYGLVALAGIMWGTGFLYIQFVLNGGLSPQEIVSWKMLIGFLFMLLYTLKRDPKALKIDMRGLLLIAALGLVCHTLYNLFMNLAVERTTIATTVALLYTAPFFVLIISRFLFNERFTVLKVVSMIIAISGVYMTVTGGRSDQLAFDSTGILFGLGAGFAYGLMNLYSKYLVVYYKQQTILTYAFGFAFLFSLSFSNPLAVFQLDFNPLLWLNLILLGLVPTALSYGFFTAGLTYPIESSKAAIIATIEVPVSVLGSYLIFSEALNFMKIIGILMVLFSVFLLRREMQSPKIPTRENRVTVPSRSVDNIKELE